MRIAQNPLVKQADEILCATAKWSDLADEFDVDTFENQITTVRITTPSDTPVILDLHIASIRALGPTACDDTQVAAWTQKKEDTEMGTV